MLLLSLTAVQNMNRISFLFLHVFEVNEHMQSLKFLVEVTLNDV